MSMAAGEQITLSGDANLVFVFISGAVFNLGAGAWFLLSGGAQAKNVYRVISTFGALALLDELPPATSCGVSVIPAVAIPALAVLAVAVLDAGTYKSIKVTINFKSHLSKLSATQKRKLLLLVAKFDPKVIDGNRTKDIKLSATRARGVARNLSDNGVKIPMLTQGKGTLNASARSRKATLTIRYIK